MTFMTQDIEIKDKNIIGLVSDSHGDMTALSAALDVLARHGAKTKIHLGDVFDSLSMERLLPMIEMLKSHRVASVKGNNDYQIEKQLLNGHSKHVPGPAKEKILLFLTQMPMKIVQNDICFTHSLPYDTIRSLYEPVDTGSIDRALEIFDHTPFRVIFCGHSHAPVLFRWRRGRVAREAIPADQWLRFRDDERYIIIVGSSENRECGLLGPDNSHYRRITI